MGIGHRALGTGHWALGTGHWALGTGHWALGTGHWAAGTGHWALGTGHWAAGTGHRALGIRHQSLGIGHRCVNQIVTSHGHMTSFRNVVLVPSATASFCVNSLCCYRFFFVISFGERSIKRSLLNSFRFVPVGCPVLSKSWFLKCLSRRLICSASLIRFWFPDFVLRFSGCTHIRDQPTKYKKATLISCAGHLSSPCAHLAASSLIKLTSVPAKCFQVSS